MDAAEVLTIKEIHERFPSEWVLLDEPDLAPGPEILGGKVLFHSPKRRDVYDYALANRPVFPAFIYTGDIPRDMIVVLCGSASIPPVG